MGGPKVTMDKEKLGNISWSFYANGERIEFLTTIKPTAQQMQAKILQEQILSQDPSPVLPLITKKRLLTK